MKTISTTCSILLFATLLAAQAPANFWRDVTYQEIFLPETAETATLPEAYRTVSLDLDALRNHLRTAPAEGSDQAKSGALQISLPMPDGSLEVFKVWDSPVMHPELAARFPMIRTFAGRGISNPANTVRFGYGPDGFHAIILAPNGGSLIAPYATRQSQYYTCSTISEYLKATETAPLGHPETAFEETSLDPTPPAIGTQIQLRGGSSDLTKLHVYDYALACTGEFANLFGGTVVAVMNAFVTSTNLVNGLLERDHAIRLVLVPNEEQLIFLDPNTDPYTQLPNSELLFQQNENILNLRVGEFNYDVGQVYTSYPCRNEEGNAIGGANDANGRFCNPRKAWAFSCLSSANIAGFAIGTAAHEIAHQLSASHTMNSCPGPLQGQRSFSNAFEPGSGSTILSYKGGCEGGNNIPGPDGVYYHGSNIEQVYNYSRLDFGITCPTVIETSNHTPDLELPYMNGFNIPVGTPFELMANATDEDNDPLTYCWEQMNLGPEINLGEQEGTSPSFRSYDPAASPARVFPKLSTILSNGSDITELLPTYSRNLKFRCTVRDNNISEGAGGVTWTDISFEATATAGPFLVTSPNTSATVWKAGQLVEVTWDVANTDNELVNCKTVNIKLSLNGGNTFPHTLITSTPNDGSEMVFVPDVTSVAARIRVEAADNIFFDLSNENFQIQAAEGPAYTLTVNPQVQRVCVPGNAIVEVVTGAVQNFGLPVELEITEGLPNGFGVSFSENPVIPGQSVQLTIQMNNVSSNSSYELLLRAVGGTDTTYLPLYFNTIYTDFSSLALENPADGSSGQGLLPTFNWTDLPHVDLYDFQLSTSPDFEAGTVIEEVFDLPTASHVPDVASLLENKIYYWRVRPSNECAEGAWTLPATFQTFQVVCTPFNSADVPISISGVGTPTIESSLNILQNGVITDVNVARLKGNHDALPHIEASLVSPAGTEVVLFSAVCGNVAVFDMALDDEAPNPIACPPINLLKYKPQNPLSAFDGENTFGNWKMKIKVINNAGQGGALQNWGLEFCASVQPNNPFVVQNDTLPVPPGETRSILNLHLTVEDSDNDAGQLQFTVVANTQFGFVSNDGAQLPVGGHFTMADILAGKVAYTNTDPGALSDFFTFIVEDGTGGWLGTPKFNIKIAPDEPTAVDEKAFANSIQLFPNPAKNLLNVAFQQPLSGDAVLSVTDIAGRQVKGQMVEKTRRQLQISLDGFAEGMYFLNVRTKDGVFAKKFLVQR